MKLNCLALVFASWMSYAVAQETGEPAPHAADAKSLAIAAKRIATAQHQNGIESPGRVVVVYFTPKDRKPAAGHPDRISRIVQATATFYEQELQRHGFPGRSLELLRSAGEKSAGEKSAGEKSAGEKSAGEKSADEKIAVIDVVGEDIDKNYGKSDGRRIRNEIVPVLRAAKIDPEASVLLIFCNLMDYDAKKSTISHHSPYYGGGSYLTGTAWQCDSEILDPLRLKDLTPIQDGEYGRITIGRHNSIFIGGVIHELGHALALPHCKQRADEAKRGTALMGSGNRTYAQQLRGEGRGTFLTQAHALRLAAHPAFNSEAPSALYDRPHTDWNDLRMDVAPDKAIRIRGRVNATVDVHGVIAYFDPAGRSNYDATTATAVPDAEGNFALRSGTLKRDLAGQLRLVACHVNGATTQRTVSYRIDADGTPDLSGIRLELELAEMVDALRQGDLNTASAALEHSAKGDAQLKSIGQRVIKRFREHGQSVASSVDPNSIPKSSSSVPLSSLKPQSANVGWIRPTYDRVPSKEVLLSVGGDYFASGIYAHAPAKHRYRIDGQWEKLQGQCGLQSGHPGKVDFEIRGDGRLLWSRRGAGEGPAVSFDVDVNGIKELELIVTDGGNGGSSDWGVWVEPTLLR